MRSRLANSPSYRPCQSPLFLALRPEVPERPKMEGFQHLVLLLRSQHLRGFFRGPGRRKSLRPVGDPVSRYPFSSPFFPTRPAHLPCGTHPATQPQPSLYALPSPP